MVMRVVQPAEKEGRRGQRVIAAVVVGIKERRRVKAEGGVEMIGWSHEQQDGCRRVVKPRGNKTGGIVGNAEGGAEGGAGRGFRPPSGWSVVHAGPPRRRPPNLHPLIKQENKDVHVIRKADPSKGGKGARWRLGNK